ncbi:MULTISPECIES: hypothetical protein [unclassified Bacillus (in: firmicutes)]|uniref:hypothetical protein n=1 Tax=unclassified Bacillus (in: firmicutes) TaxID=185979 RepID=UPI0029500108|nr:MULTISPECIES: hypothetical protein [unclassified Bacillus (in: firmicutes)]
MLEKNGYNFARDTKGWRQYNESDLSAMEYIYTHSKLSGKSLEEVAKLVHIGYRYTATRYQCRRSHSKTRRIQSGHPKTTRTI